MVLQMSEVPYNQLNSHL